MPRFHSHWGPPPPPHELPHHHRGHWGGHAEVQALTELLQRYVSPSDASWAADVIAHDPGPGRLHGLLSLALLERVDALLERQVGKQQAEADPMVDTP